MGDEKNGEYDAHVRKFGKKIIRKDATVKTIRGKYNSNSKISNGRKSHNDKK